MKRTMKLAAFVFIILLFHLNDTDLYAQTNDSKMLLKAFKENSTDYASIESNMEAKRVQYQIYKDKYEQAKEKEESSLKLNITDEVKESLLLSTQENWLMMQNYLFYDEKADKLVEIQKSKLESDFLVKYFQLTVYDSYLKMYKVLKKQYIYNINLEKRKRKLGYGSEENIQNEKQNLSDLESSIKELKQEKEKMCATISEETGIQKFNISSSLPVSPSVLSQNEYVKKFSELETFKFYDWKVNAYNQYLNNVSDKLLDNQVFTRYCQNQIDLVKEEQKSEQKKIVTNVRELLSQYKQIMNSIKNSKKKMKACNQKLQKYKKAYKAGFIKKSEIYELESVKAKNEAELTSLRFELLKIKYQLRC